MKLVQAKKITLMMFCIFLMSYLLIVLGIKLSWFNAYHTIQTVNSDHTIFSFIYKPYAIVCGFQSLVYGISFYVLGLGKLNNRKKISKWLLLLGILFLTGLFLFSINKYYWGIWSYLSLWERWLNILIDYIIDFCLHEKIIPILFWIISAILISWVFIKNNIIIEA